ncbi:MAG TPA: hypothetical protein VIU64_22085 [Polyangia bacterium]
MPELAITGVGMASSLSLDVISSCAAARAGLSRTRDLDLVAFDADAMVSVPLKGHVAARGLTLGFEGLGRWSQLAEAGLRDLLSYAGLEAHHAARTGLVMNLPGSTYEDAARSGDLSDIADAGLRAQLEADGDDEQAAARAQVERSFLSTLPALQEFAAAPTARVIQFGGAASFVAALEAARQWLGARVVDRCIVGGIDSKVDAAALAPFHQLGLARTPSNPVGCFPGEAAAFVLLERPEIARARGARIEATLSAAASANETGSRFHRRPPAPSQAMARAVAQCLTEGSCAAGEVQLSIVNHNGEQLRAQEVGATWARLSMGGVRLEGQQWFTGQAFGEIGAASGPAAIAMAVRGLARGYARSRRVLVMLFDDDEARGAVLVDAASPAAERRSAHG